MATVAHSRPRGSSPSMGSGSLGRRMVQWLRGVVHFSGAGSKCGNVGSRRQTLGSQEAQAALTDTSSPAKNIQECHTPTASHRVTEEVHPYAARQATCGGLRSLQQITCLETACQHNQPHQSKTRASATRSCIFTVQSYLSDSKHCGWLNQPNAKPEIGGSPMCPGAPVPGACGGFSFAVCMNEDHCHYEASFMAALSFDGKLWLANCKPPPMDVCAAGSCELLLDFERGACALVGPKSATEAAWHLGPFLGTHVGECDLRGRSAPEAQRRACLLTLDFFGHVPVSLPKQLQFLF